MSKSQMKKSVALSFGKRDLTKPNHWQDLDFNKYRITKPTVICLGGNTTKTSSDVNAICKLASNLIGLKAPIDNEQATTNDVDILGVAYGDMQDSPNHNTVAVTRQEISNLVNTLLLPLAVDDNGKRLSLEEAEKNFCNVNFFCHCYGARVLNEMNFDLIRKMMEIGYSSNEILTIQKQMTAVSYAPIEEVFNMPSLQAFSARDFTSMIPLNANENFEKIYYDVFEGRTEFNGNYVFKEDENTVTLFTSAMSQKPGNEHSVIFVGRNEDWRYPLLCPDHADEVSQVVGYTLASAVATGVQNQHSTEFMPKPTPEQILESATSILGNTQQDLGFSQ